MDTIAFLPVIDLPLTGLLLAGFLLNSWHWAKTGSTESNVDLEARLPRALIKISLFFAVTLVVCWLINLGAWTLFLVLLVVGLLVTIFAGRHAFAPEMMFVFTAGMLREWAFGFPNLILAPPTNNRPTEEEAGQEFLGKLAVATSPLRPSFLQYRIAVH